jgi:NSS family neurotransmitter:Na+ symporter
VFGQYSLVVGALLISVFVAWVWGVRAAGEEVAADGTGFTFEGAWRFLIRFLCPMAILALIIDFGARLAGAGGLVELVSRASGAG